MIFFGGVDINGGDWREFLRKIIVGGPTTSCLGLRKSIYKIKDVDFYSHIVLKDMTRILTGKSAHTH